MRVLLVEDDVLIGESVAQGLEMEYYAVHRLLDGGHAELALPTTPYDVLLLDLGLPGK